MKRFKEFLARKDIEFSVKRYFIDGLSAMAVGLFSTLIIGLIIQTLGDQLAALFGPNPIFDALVELGNTAKGLFQIGHFRTPPRPA